MREGFVYSDGGRVEAGYKGRAGDCVCRSIAIATNQPYKEVYTALGKLYKALPKGRGVSSARDGVPREVYQPYLESIGWKWVPTMGIGTGCKIHLDADELPEGRIICRLTKHLTAVIDGVIYDTHDPRRYGVEYIDGVKKKLPQRCVYGYFIQK